MANVPQNPKTDIGTIVRTSVLAVALINQLLAATGYSPLPFDDEAVEMLVSSIFTAAAALATWWKDNDITRKAKQARHLAKREGLKK